ncbi:hypothetical protein EBU95_07590 [bacterium]|nr:hypothetical protein [bacterium]
MTAQNENQNQNQNNPLIEDEVYSLRISRRDIELLFKYIARADLKGAEVPEMNKVISIFDPKNLNKI